LFTYLETELERIILEKDPESAFSQLVYLNSFYNQAVQVVAAIKPGAIRGSAGRLGRIISQNLKNAVNSVGNGIHAKDYSIGITAPFGFSVSFTWRVV
jgi:hypothetical protein